MQQTSNSSSKSTIFCGLIAAAIGVFYLALSIGLFPTTAQRSDQEPGWLGAAFGLTFLLGGSAVIIQAIFGDGKSSSQGLPNATPFWIQSFYKLLCLGIVISIGAIATWVAFGPGSRHLQAMALFSVRQVAELRLVLAPF
jgi:H+/Cl- antiporter ClcA